MRKWLLVGSMCVALSVTGCSGGDDSGTAAEGGQSEAAGGGQEAPAANDQGSITGKWLGPKDGANNETFEFSGDGTVSLSSEGTTCKGTVEAGGGERTYSFKVDCGEGPFPGTAVVSPDGETITLTDPEGEKSEYGRVSG
ncbi:hypothetical protein BJF79_24130 [Actinomadura sp. CNU-125]|uniref:hypothetical protein n=1 Tax=Actinomadura sp. CNU-125 TaxID=1904961 RepID=UPI000961D0B6|nr:hypothetical protein [Actinomadura sp. CNU-125]OLT11420.1 hypothetical protein BJF79_24130 [Actinomadura sp. CNU-125]